MSIYHFKNKRARAKAAKTIREKSQRRKAEATRAGTTSGHLSMERIDAYWRKVEDPDYYKGIRFGMALRSALGGMK